VKILREHLSFRPLPATGPIELKARGLVLTFEGDGLHIRHEGSTAKEIGFVPI
jgi:hypothetical protein